MKRKLGLFAILILVIFGLNVALHGTTVTAPYDTMPVDQMLDEVLVNNTVANQWHYTNMIFKPTDSGGNVLREVPINDYGRSIYDQFSNGLYKQTAVNKTDGNAILFECGTVPKVDAQAVVDQILAGYVAFFLDHYELFWLTGGYFVSWQYYESGANYEEYTVKVYPHLVDEYRIVPGGGQQQDNYTIKSDLIASDLRKLLTIRDDVVTKALVKTNNYERIKYVHDWLAINNVYNQVGGVSHSPVGALLDEYSPVCEAYAEASFLLLNYLHVPTLIGIGPARTSGSFELHAWNYILMEDNKWYLMDATWDDGGLLPSYDYFLVPNEPTSKRVLDNADILTLDFATAKYVYNPATDDKFPVRIYSDASKTTLLATELLAKGTDLTTFDGSLYCPEGYEFVSWDKTIANLQSAVDIYPISKIKTFTVTFKYGEQTKTVTVNYGESAVAPAFDPIARHKFIQWDTTFNNVKSDLVVTAQFEILASDLPVTGLTITFEVDGTVYTTKQDIFGDDVYFIVPENIPENKLFLYWKTTASRQKPSGTVQEFVDRDEYFLENAILEAVFWDISAVSGTTLFKDKFSVQGPIQEITVVNPNVNISYELPEGLKTGQVGTYTVSVTYQSKYSLNQVTKQYTITLTDQPVEDGNSDSSMPPILAAIKEFIMDNMLYIIVGVVGVFGIIILVAVFRKKS